MEIRKPTISDMTNANHTHGNAAGGGTLANDLISYAIQGAEFKNALTVTANAIDWATGFYKAITLTANTTFTFTNPEIGKTIWLKMTGAFIPTLPAGCTITGGGSYTGAKQNNILITCVASGEYKVTISQEP